jgi:hypothetical protein
VRKWSPFITLLLALMIMIALAAPVIAQAITNLPPPLLQTDRRFEHTIIYDIGGLISIDRQLGHACITGAVKNQRVSGYGEMTKSETVRMANNIITVDETSDWSVPANALGGLTVSTTIQLCSRPMSAAAENYEISPGIVINKGDIINVYNPHVVSGDIDVYGLTQQLWATRLQTNPGHEGSYHSNFLAAYGPGPYEEEHGAIDPDGILFKYHDKYMWEYDENVHYLDRDDKQKGYERGEFYVGNFFEIDQFAYTSGGAMDRLISMSNPFENALLEEDLSVTGMASVREYFEMHNLKGGPKAVTLAWYDLF